ncbi:MAG: lysylphosphatidylglycerol synthase domain-containing protein [Phycisphaerales bacterium]
MSATQPDPVNAAPAQRRLGRLVVRLLGIALGAASLGWCVWMAVDPGNPERQSQFERLRHADPGMIAAMLALSLGTVVINALLFWALLAPVRRLRVVDMLAVNGACMLISYLPLKLGAVFRVLVHNRRDRIPLATIGAWFAAMVVVMGVAYAPPVLATLWLGSITPAWFGAVAAGEILGIVVLVAGARLLRGHTGLDRLARFVGAIPLLPLGRVLRTRLWGNLHAGFDMLASPGAVAGSVLLRLADMGIHASRFIVAATILGVDLPPAQALPISVAYFLIGIVSPSGLAGLREGAATGLAGLLLASAGATREAISAFAAVALLVSATEAVVYLSVGVAGLAWLRPDRLLRVKGPAGCGAQDSAAGPRAQPDPPRATVPREP